MPILEGVPRVLKIYMHKHIDIYVCLHEIEQKHAHEKENSTMTFYNVTNYISCNSTPHVSI